MKSENRKKLIDRYLHNKATEAEILVFFEELKDESFVSLLENESSNRISPIKRTFRIWWAAAVLAISLLGLSYYQLRDMNPSLLENNIPDLAHYLPAENKAILWVDGEAVSSLASTQDYTQQVEHLQNQAEDIQYITVETKTANTFKLTLPDSSLVFLNAGSKLRFPNRFTADKREVELYGEAYFDIVSNAEKPFIVRSNRQENNSERPMDIAVTGTKFVVSNYADMDRAHMALLEGKVEVNKMTIKPGFVYQLEGGRQLIYHAQNINRYVDWVQGVFEFDGERLSAIMLKIEKWYGVKFIGKKIENNETFGGMIARSVPLKDILLLFQEHTNLRFEQAPNNQIIVK